MKRRELALSLGELIVGVDIDGAIEKAIERCKHFELIILYSN
jgi:Flp pilus assembly protein TadB